MVTPCVCHIPGDPAWSANPGYCCCGRSSCCGSPYCGRPAIPGGCWPASPGCCCCCYGCYCMCSLGTICGLGVTGGPHRDCDRGQSDTLGPACGPHRPPTPNGNGSNGGSSGCSCPTLQQEKRVQPPLGLPVVAGPIQPGRPVRPGCPVPPPSEKKSNQPVGPVSVLVPLPSGRSPSPPAPPLQPWTFGDADRLSFSQSNSPPPRNTARFPLSILLALLSSKTGWTP